jgi:hypothetical protein
MVELIRRHARERYLAMRQTSTLYPDDLYRQYHASELSLTLLLDYVIAPEFPPGTPPVNVTDHIHEATTTLFTLVQLGTPLDQVVPKVRFVQGRRLVLPPGAAHVLVRVVLLLAEAAILDTALYVVCSLPNRVDDRWVIELEADVLGMLSSDTDPAQCMAPLAAVLDGMGATITATRSDTGSLIRISLPVAGGAV